jgi:hypothetical protein
METLLLTFIVFAVAVLAMVAGVLITGRSLKGSCGGPSCKCTVTGENVHECGVEKAPREGSLPVV